MNTAGTAWLLGVCKCHAQAIGDRCGDEGGKNAPNSASRWRFVTPLVSALNLAQQNLAARGVGY